MPRDRRLTSLSSRLSARTVVAIAVIVSLCLLVTAAIFEVSVRRQAREVGEVAAAQAAAEVLGTFERPIGVVYGMRSAITTARDRGMVDRTFHEDILRSTLLDNPELLGTWTGWEANAFDGKDAAYINAPAHDRTGRFVPYWHRGAGPQGIVLEVMRDYDKPGLGAYYLSAQQSQSPVLIEPYAYALGHRMVLMTSITLPVSRDGRGVGVVAGDLALDALQRRIGQMHVPFGGRIALISAGRLYAYHASSALLGKPAPKSSGPFAILEDAQLGQVMRVESPVHFPGFRQVWAVQVDLPMGAVMATARSVELALLLCAIVMIAGLGWLVRRNTRRIVGLPLEAIKAEMSALAHGDLSEPEPRAADSLEMAEMQAALGVFRANALAREAADAEQIQAVEALGRSLARIAEGDLTASLEGRFQGPLERLQRDFNAAMQQVAAAFAAVSDSTSAVHIGSEQIRSASLDLSDRTDQQAVGLAQMTLAFEGIARQARQAADAAHDARGVIDAFRGEVEQSGAVMRRAAEAMNELKHSSAQIIDIIGVIDGISFQTSLLALNASVEAARAGDAGRGFAVVAAEVRALAGRSSEAASIIKTRIGASLDQIHIGVSLVDETQGGLQRLATRMSEVTGLAHAISEASQQQLSGVNAVSDTVDYLDNFTRKNAAMVEESAAAARNLSELADDLARQVGMFQIEPVTKPDPRPVRAAKNVRAA